MLKLHATLCERLGLNAYIQGDYATALRWFRRLEVAEPDSLRVLRNLGVLLLALGDPEGARTYLLREESLYGPSFHRHTALGDLAWAVGDRREAARRYAAALAEPEAEAGGRGAASRPLLEARLGLAATDQSFAPSRTSLERFAAGEAARDKGDAEGALALFLEAASLDPTNWPAYNNAGTLYLNVLDRPWEAADCFSRALAFTATPQIARNLHLAEEALARKDKGRKP